MEGNPVNPTHANDETVPQNHVDVGLNPIPEDYVDIGTAPVLGNHINEVTLIPKNHVDKGTVHVRTGMLTEVRTLPRIKGPTTLLWMHEPSLVQGYSVTILRRDRVGPDAE